MAHPSREVFINQDELLKKAKKINAAEDSEDESSGDEDENKEKKSHKKVEKRKSSSSSHKAEGSGGGEGGHRVKSMSMGTGPPDEGAPRDSGGSHSRGGGRLGKHVSVWNKVKHCRVSGGNAPLQTQLAKFLVDNPNYEVWVGQDKIRKRKSVEDGLEGQGLEEAATGGDGSAGDEVGMDTTTADDAAAMLEEGGVEDHGKTTMVLGEPSVASDFDVIANTTSTSNPTKKRIPSPQATRSGRPWLRGLRVEWLWHH